MYWLTVAVHVVPLLKVSVNSISMLITCYHFHATSSRISFVETAKFGYFSLNWPIDNNMNVLQKSNSFSEARHLKSVDYLHDDGDLNRAKAASADMTRS